MHARSMPKADSLFSIKPSPKHVYALNPHARDPLTWGQPSTSMDENAGARVLQLIGLSARGTKEAHRKTQHRYETIRSYHVKGLGVLPAAGAWGPPTGGPSRGPTWVTDCNGHRARAPHLDAFENGAREKLLYVPCIVPDASRPDYLTTIDADPESKTYCQVIHRLHMPNKGDELHHSGWNACSSCHSDPDAPKRSLLILPGIISSRVHAVDTAMDPRAPKLVSVCERSTVDTATDPRAPKLVSGAGAGAGAGNWVLLDQDLQVKGSWAEESAPYGYDFWYQPRLNVMVSTAWGAPSAFTKGFNPAEVAELYSDTIHFWDWKERKMLQEVAELYGDTIHFWDWKERKMLQEIKLEGWMLPAVPPLVVDILVSMDDKYLYYSNWLRANPKFAGRVWVGGLIRKGGGLTVIDGLPEDTPEAPEIPEIQGHKLLGGPQMIQLSLDGKRLYVTNSLFAAWPTDGKRLYVKNFLFSQWVGTGAAVDIVTGVAVAVVAVVAVVAAALRWGEATVTNSRFAAWPRDGERFYVKNSRFAAWVSSCSAVVAAVAVGSSCGS
eukprot:gene19284-25927_t